jgi:hypothetical protein
MSCALKKKNFWDKPEYQGKTKYRFIRFWLKTTMASKEWKYIVTYLQVKHPGEKIWKIDQDYDNKKCFDVWVAMGDNAPFRLPAGCLPPTAPKPPTECEIAYQLGQQISETWSSM